MNGTLAPLKIDIFLFSSESVETIISSNKLDFIAVSIAYDIIGFPKKSFMFLLGILLLPLWQE